MLGLRTLAPSDLPEVLRVQRSAYSTGYLEPAGAFARKLSLFPRGAIGCFDGGVLMAYVFCHPWTLGEVVPLGDGSMELPRRPTCLYIHDLAVEQSKSRGGLATLLVTEVFKLAKEMHLPACALVAVQGSEGFWKRLGFNGERQLEYLPGVRATYMVRSGPLGSAPR